MAFDANKFLVLAVGLAAAGGAGAAIYSSMGDEEASADGDAQSTTGPARADEEHFPEAPPEPDVPPQKLDVGTPAPPEDDTAAPGPTHEGMHPVGEGM